MSERPDETAAIQRYLELDTGIPGPEWIAEDAIWRHWRWGDQELVGRERIVRDYLSKLDESYPDWTFKVHQAIIDRDMLVVRGQFHANFNKSFHGVAATDDEVTWRAHDIFRFADGKIAEAWYANDTYVVAREMGVIPKDAPWPWHLPGSSEPVAG